MDIVSSYFSSLIFQAVETRDSHVVYAARIADMLSTGARYVLVYVPIQYATLRNASLDKLNWDVIQTRSLVNSYKLKPQKWIYSRKLPDFNLDQVERTLNYTKFLPENKEIPLEVTMLHDLRKNTKYQYGRQISMSGALEKFCCIVTYIHKPLQLSDPTNEGSFELIK